jgi:IS30 family transposase
MSRLTEDKVREIRRLHEAGLATKRDLARRFGVVKSVIRSVIARETWVHVV